MPSSVASNSGLHSHAVTDIANIANRRYSWKANCKGGAYECDDGDNLADGTG